MIKGDDVKLVVDQKKKERLKRRVILFIKIKTYLILIFKRFELKFYFFREMLTSDFRTSALRALDKRFKMEAVLEFVYSAH